MQDVHKAYAYVTRTRHKRRELLVFRHPDPSAGIQVPKGTIRADESAAEAVLRELAEESGITLEEVGRVEMLRADRWRPADAPDEHVIRYFYHIEVDDERPRWQHVVTGDGVDHGMVFEYFWEPLPLNKKKTLIAQMDDYVHLLR